MDQMESEFSDYDEIYYNYFAPTLVAYVRWVLSEAKKNEIKRLYFLARDGYSMYHIARMLQKDTNDIEIRYLYVSRYAVRRAEYHMLGDKSLDMICSNGIAVTPERIMTRAGLTDGETDYILEQLAPGDEKKAILDTAQLAAFKKKLRQHSDFMGLVVKHSQECLEEVQGYLRQEGLFDEIKYATVDCGWIGTLQRSIMHLVNREFDGFYFGLYQTPIDVDERWYHTYYFSKRTGLKRKVYFANCLFEAMVSAPEGMTLGYQIISVDGQDSYVPRKTEVNEHFRERQEKNKNLCLKYIAENMQDKEQQKSATKSGDKLDGNKVELLLQKLMGNPSVKEARVLGEQQFCDDVIEFQMQSVAPIWNDKELFNQSLPMKILIKSGISKEVLHDSAWPEGTIVLTGKMTQWNLWQQRSYKYLMYMRMQR